MPNRVMIIGCSPEEEQILKGQLSLMGYETCTSSEWNGGEAARTIPSSSLVILNVTDPEQIDSSLTLLHRHREDLPLLLLVPPEHLLRMMRWTTIPTLGFLIKPYTFIELQAHVHSLLRKDASNSPATFLMAQVIHDLRNYLGFVTSAADLLLNTKAVADEEGKKMVRDIRRCSREIQNLMENFLCMSAMESQGSFQPEEEVDLKALIEKEVLLLQKYQAPHPVVIQGEWVPVEGNRTAMGRIFSNLLSNAWKYSPGGSPVSIRAARANGILQVTITNAGKGIPEDHLDRLFQPFFRIQECSQSVPGTGLGLYVVKNLMERQGGEVRVSSRGGIGASFVLSFPAAKEREEAVLEGPARRVPLFSEISKISKILPPAGSKRPPQAGPPKAGPPQVGSLEGELARKAI